jgi:hypothetical protein
MAILPIGETPNLYECCYRSMKFLSPHLDAWQPEAEIDGSESIDRRSNLDCTRRELFEALNQQIAGRFEASSWLL